MNIFINGRPIDPRLTKTIIREYEKQKFDKIRNEAVDAELIGKEEINEQIERPRDNGSTQK